MTQDGAWEGYRAFVVDRKEPESDTVTSFYLVPQDGGAIAPHHAGQYLGFSLQVPGRMTPVIRTYTISEAAADQDHYRLSIKRELAPPDAPDALPGVSSNFFHDHVEVGTELQVRAPAGDFVVRPEGKGSVVLLSGGIGCTPMFSMLQAIAAADTTRDVWYVHGVRSGAEHAFGPEIRVIAAAHDNIRAHVCYSQPGAGDVAGTDYDTEGHVTSDLLKELLPDTRPMFYLCGSTPFMKSMYNGLIEWGVDELQIFYEFFGTACELKEKPPVTAESAAADMGLAADTSFQVEFRQSGVSATWTPASGTILDLAEANGVDQDFICRAGMCHTCLSTVLEGETAYLHDDVVPPPGDDEVLICSARPKTDVVIDV